MCGWEKPPCPACPERSSHNRRQKYAQRSAESARFFHFRPSVSTGKVFSSIVQKPTNIQLIGTEVAILWDDGAETYFQAELLRANSPSAENIGERDIMGNQYGGDGPKSFPGVTVLGWDVVGSYAVRFVFSDGHKTGLYSFDFLRELAQRHP